ncbi:MAG: hypothetical protein M0D57_07260 [Sphingobacteriales bacterium JAD_PAG50586_3]|nr:MAG: hypothetical protein M0D57_07260 [Sphingobacteriales bacterium JAD_PAG50586_3]
MRLLVTVTVFLLAVTVNAQTNYYSKAAATDFNSTASWGVNTDGSGAAPASISNANNFIIQNNSVMSLSGAAAVRTLVINAGALTVGSNTLTVSLATGNTSNLTVNTGGSLTVGAGSSIVLNGNMLIANGANFTQSGGLITIDGNSNTGVVGNATSVASATPLFAIGTGSQNYNSGTLSFTGGKITIVDPHIGSNTTTNAYAFYARVAAASSVNATNHTVEFGDGTSTAAGGTGGFVFDGYVGAGSFNFFNLTVNSAAGTNRGVIQQTNTQTINGDLTISKGTFSQNALTTYIGGNILVDGSTSNLIANSLFYFCQTVGTTISAQTTAQSVSVANSGTINNLSNKPNGKFYQYNYQQHI